MGLLMASFGETFVTKSYVKGKKKMAGRGVSGLTPSQKLARTKRMSTEGPKKTMPNPMSSVAKKAMQNMGTRGQRPPMTKKVTRNVSKRGMR